MFRQIWMVLFLIASSSAFATRTYVELGVETELLDDLNISINPEWRTDPDKNKDQYHTDLSLSYALTKGWDLGVGYRRGEVFYDDGADSVEIERSNIDTSYKWKFDDFSLDTRIRYTNGTDDDGDDKEYLRYRLKLGYDWNALNLEPFLAYEKYDSLEADFDQNPNVYSGGLSWKINQQHQLKAEYRWVDKLHSRKDYGVFKLTYQFDF